MRDHAQLTQLSKYMSYVLRHAPEAGGLTLDPEGWAAVADLVAGGAKAGHRLDAELIRHVVETSDKKRFALSPDGRLIRAVQGHSAADVAIAYDALVPPQRLYHGTATRFLASILKGGLRSGERHYVHLSADAATARSVGARYGRPAVLTVRAGEMHLAGHVFHCAANGVWLTRAVPPQYLSADERRLRQAPAPREGD